MCPFQCAPIRLVCCHTLFSFLHAGTTRAQRWQRYARIHVPFELVLEFEFMCACNSIKKKVPTNLVFEICTQYHTLKEARAVNFSRSLLTNHLIYFYYRKLCCKSRFRSSELTFSIASNSPRTFYSKVTNNVSALKSDVCHWEKRCREKKVKYCGKFARLEKGSWKWNLHE